MIRQTIHILFRCRLSDATASRSAGKLIEEYGILRFECTRTSERQGCGCIAKPLAAPIGYRLPAKIGVVCKFDSLEAPAGRVVFVAERHVERVIEWRHERSRSHT